jgi:hypothetical protein
MGLQNASTLRQAPAAPEAGAPSPDVDGKPCDLKSDTFLTVTTWELHPEPVGRGISKP